MSETKNDGGPAFPQPCTDLGYPANTPYQMAGGGMIMRDYFAAHAPPVPDAFQFQPPPLQRPAEAQIDSYPEHLHKRMREWQLDGCWELTDKNLPADDNRLLRRFDDATSAFTRACFDHAKQVELERVVAWRWHYADMMLARRNA